MKPVDAGTRDYREIYWRFYVRNAPGWTGGGGDKVTRAIVFASPTWSQAVAAHLWSGTGASSSFLLLDPASGTDAAGTLKTTEGHLGGAQPARQLFELRYQLYFSGELLERRLTGRAGALL